MGPCVRTALFCIVVYCNVLHCTGLYCLVLYAVSAVPWCLPVVKVAVAGGCHDHVMA